MIRVPNPRIVGAMAGAFPGAALIALLIAAYALAGESAPSDRPRTECVAVAEIPDYTTIVPGQVERCRPVTTVEP
jgi:hypothetical protein